MYADVFSLLQWYADGDIVLCVRIPEVPYVCQLLTVVLLDSSHLMAYSAGRSSTYQPYHFVELPYSRHGVISFADSLDCVGLIGKDIDVTSQMFRTLDDTTL